MHVPRSVAGKSRVPLVLMFHGRPEAGFVFEGVGDDELIGDFGYANGGAAGDEIDRADVDNGTPIDALILATARNFSDDYWEPVDDILSQVLGPVRGCTHPFVRADMVLIPRTDRGSVFSVGSISWTASLGWNNYNNNVSTITRNVLESFLESGIHPRPTRADMRRRARVHS